MDELSALKIIFKNNFLEKNGFLIIKHGGQIYKINLENMKIDNPEYDYIDCYDYILKSKVLKIDSKTDDLQEIDVNQTEVEKITEEEFLEWQMGRLVLEEKQLGLSGKEIWMLNKLEE